MSFLRPWLDNLSCFLAASEQTSALFSHFPLCDPGAMVCPVPQVCGWGQPPSHLLKSLKLSAQPLYLPTCSGTLGHLLVYLPPAACPGLLYCSCTTCFSSRPSGISSTCLTSVGVSGSISNSIFPVPTEMNPSEAVGAGVEI